MSAGKADVTRNSDGLKKSSSKLLQFHRILSWGEDGLRVWPASEGQPLAVMKHEGWVRGAVFNQDESRILSWGGNGLQVWPTSGGQPLAVMKHEGGVWGAVFNQDESRILSWGEDGLRVWPASGGQPLAVMQPEGEVLGAAFSKDESRILFWGEDAVYSWHILPDSDFPKELFILQIKAITGTTINLNNQTIYSLPAKEWEEINKEYLKQAQEHYKKCNYPEANLWRRFYPEEAKKVRTR